MLLDATGKYAVIFVSWGGSD